MAVQGVLGGEVDGFVKEGDLAFVVLLVAEVAVADEALAGDAFDRVGLEDGVVAAGVAVVATEVVVSGEVNGENFNFHRGRESESGFGKMESGKFRGVFSGGLGWCFGGRF